MYRTFGYADPRRLHAMPPRAAFLNHSRSGRVYALYGLLVTGIDVHIQYTAQTTILLIVHVRAASLTVIIRVALKAVTDTVTPPPVLANKVFLWALGRSGSRLFALK